MSKPKNWPENLTYLTHPLHDPQLSHAQLQSLQPVPAKTPILTSALTRTPSPLVRISRLASTAHPAHGQHGLFAARALPPSSFIVAYLGRVLPGSGCRPGSAYELWLDREADVAVDAVAEGNEARFVNDYRGVAGRPNAVFATAWAERWGQTVVAVWVAAGKNGIRKGEEILVSYGKGFWEARKGEEEG